MVGAQWLMKVANNDDDEDSKQLTFSVLAFLETSLSIANSTARSSVRFWVVSSRKLFNLSTRKYDALHF